MRSKRTALLSLGLCLCLLVSACAGPSPEEFSHPAEDSSESAPVPADPNAAFVRGLLEDLLTEVQTTKGFAWLTEDRAERIRDSVKQLKFPILTEEDVRHIAEAALLAVTAAGENRLGTIELPACGMLTNLHWSPILSNFLYDSCFVAILTYFFYLFTPPDYVFREYEVQPGIKPPSGQIWLYLPLAGEYASRSEALALLQAGKNSLLLPLYGLSEGEHLLNPFFCKNPVLFRAAGEGRSLELFDMVMQGDMALPEDFFRSYGAAYVHKQIDRLTGADAGYGKTYASYEFPDGTRDNVFLQLTPGAVRDIREAVELFSGPILAEETVRELAERMQALVDPDLSLVLPGFDGAEDVSPDGSADRVTAYLIDLFTPSSYRFDGLSGFPGRCFALRAAVWETDSPEDALWDFTSGFTRMVHVADGMPRFVDRDGNAEPLV